MTQTGRVGLILMLALLLAACGGGTSDTASTPSGAQSPPAQTSDAPTGAPTSGPSTSGPSTSGGPTTTPDQPGPGSSGQTGTGSTSTSPADGGTPSSPSGPPPSPPPVPSPPPFVRERHRAIFIGDSLAARGFGPGGTVVSTPGGGFVVSGGPSNPIATITTTANHALMPGNYIQLFNVGDPSYAAALNGAVIPVLTAPSTMQLTVSATYAGQTMPNGDYSAGYRQQPWLVSSMNQATDQSWLQWLNQYMGSYFTVVASYAQGGTISRVGVTLLPKIQAGPKAEYAFIQYCTNDVNAGSGGPNGCLANIQTIVAAVEAMGMVPILCTPPALGDPAATPSDPASATKAQQLRTILRHEQQLAEDDPNLILLDTYSATVTPSDPAGHFQPDFAPLDGIHPSSYGEVKMAQALSAYLAKLLPITPNMDTTNILSNGLMAGNNGSVNSTATNVVDGSAPTGWSVRGTGGTSANPTSFLVSGNNTQPGTTGYSLDVTARSGAAGGGFIAGTNGAGGSSFASQLAPGNWYQCGFQLGAGTDLTNINLSGQVFMDYGGGNTPSVYFMSTNSRYDNGIPLAAGTTLQLVSQPFHVARPAAGAFLFINAVLTGAAGNRQWSLSGAFCRPVSSPYE